MPSLAYFIYFFLILKLDFIKTGWKCEMHICFQRWLYVKESLLLSYTWVRLLCTMCSSFFVGAALLALQGHHEMCCVSNVFCLRDFCRNTSQIPSMCPCSLVGTAKFPWGSLKLIQGIKRVLPRSSITDSIEALCWRGKIHLALKFVWGIWRQITVWYCPHEKVYLKAWATLCK